MIESSRARSIVFHHLLSGRLAGIGVLLLAALAGGCASAGEEFASQNVSKLQIGTTSLDECNSLFGAPHTKSQQSDASGKFDELEYTYAHADIGSAQARRMALEFKNGVLNAYDFLSSFDEDKTKADVAGLSKLEVNKTTKAEVLAAMGPPTGKGLFPTQFPDWKDNAKPGVTEVWIWMSLEKVSTFGGTPTETQMVFVYFDNSEKVVSFNNSQKKFQ